MCVKFTQGVVIISRSAEQKIKQEIRLRNSIKQRLLEGFAKTRLRLVLFVLIFSVAAAFVVAALLQSRGAFTITTPRRDMITYGFVLSETADFKYYSHELRSMPVTNMWNTTYDWLPKNLDNTDGEHNDPDGTYLAYTFYAKNTGEQPFKYTTSVDIAEMYRNVDDAMRLMLYVDGAPAIYAKRDKEGQTIEGTMPFNSATNILHLPGRLLAVGEIHKYTVVAWLEGTDPECVNDIMGGFIKMILSFHVMPLRYEKDAV